jgi:hypothetical protein
MKLRAMILGAGRGGPHIGRRFVNAREHCPSGGMARVGEGLNGPSLEERKIAMEIVRKKLPLVASLAVVLLGASCAIAQAKQETESKVTMKDLPSPVQAKVKELSKGAVRRGLSKEVENGQTFYEVELRVNGRNRDALIDSAGKVVEIEEQVPLASLPPAVKSAIVKQAGIGKIVFVESVSKENSVVAYKAHVKTAGKMSEIKVDNSGNPITK